MQSPATTTILVVEDDAMNRDMLVRMLGFNGYTVLAARNGQEAIDLATAHLPQLIVMDLSLPVLDGWEATRQIKANPHTHAIPVLALTAHAMSHHRQSSVDAGCDYYETKPVEFPRFLARIASILHH